jgi:hypothetical protein
MLKWIAPEGFTKEGRLKMEGSRPRAHLLDQPVDAHYTGTRTFEEVYAVTRCTRAGMLVSERLGEART